MDEDDMEEFISRLDLPLGFGYEEAFEEYIRRAHNPCFSRVSRQTTTRYLENTFLSVVLL